MQILVLHTVRALPSLSPAAGRTALSCAWVPSLLVPSTRAPPLSPTTAQGLFWKVFPEPVTCEGSFLCIPTVVCAPSSRHRSRRTAVTCAGICAPSHCELLEDRASSAPCVAPHGDLRTSGRKAHTDAHVPASGRPQHPSTMKTTAKGKDRARTGPEQSRVPMGAEPRLSPSQRLNVSV